MSPDLPFSSSTSLSFGGLESLLAFFFIPRSSVSHSHPSMLVRYRIPVRQVSSELPSICEPDSPRADRLASIFSFLSQIPHRHRLRRGRSSKQQNLSSQPYLQRSPLELVSSKPHLLNFVRTSSLISLAGTSRRMISLRTRPSGVWMSTVVSSR